MPDIPIHAFIASLVAVRQTGAGPEILLLKRTQTLAGAWCQVAGKIGPGETAWQAALRELREETGLTPETLYSADICEQFYEAARDAIVMAPVFVAFVDADAAVVLNPEHSDHGWMSLDGALEQVEFGGRRRVLRWIDAEFIQRKPSEHLRIEFPRP